ncbi:unannotated protein [freshwater metagenome]|uniref:Unannotated protein n=1 Tax=freshwater metagenome TaxID=449393 RepID=A0A6J7CYU6_9ZZZZ|nr:hypothetical protein [Actinomycetota bacterium]
MTETTTNVVIIAGATLVHAGMAGVLRDLVDRTDIGVFNSWAAKGLFPWNHPAHLGTIGLQADDIKLAALATFDDVVLCGISDDELPRQSLTAAGVRWRDVAPGELGAEPFTVRSAPTPRPPLFDLLAGACAPMYTDDSLPCNPARAAADLGTHLPAGAVVCGEASRSGFWLGRTYPTRELGSILLPTRRTPGFAATQAAIARRTGRFSVAVLDAIDEPTHHVMQRAKDLIIEVWSEQGPATTPTDRIRTLHQAHAAGGVHVIEIGVRLDEIDVLVAVAGAPLWHP